MVILSFSIPAYAQPDNYQKDSFITLSEFIQEADIVGIAKDKQVSLYNKIKAGGIPDVFNPEKQYLVPHGFEKSNGKFVFPDGSFLEVKKAKSKKILLTPENKNKLISITKDKEYVDNLYAKTNNFVTPLSVVFDSCWVTGYSGLVNMKYYQEQLLDMSYSQSRITYVDPSSLEVNVIGGTFQIGYNPRIDNYQQSGSTPASSSAKVYATIAGYFTNTLILHGYVADTSVWSSMEHF